jgi:hypothetical protein
MKKAMLRIVVAGVSVASLFASASIFAQGGGNGQGGTGGGNAHGAATAGMTHWGDPVSSTNSAMSGTMQNSRMDKSTNMDPMAPDSATVASKTVQ